MKQDCLEFENNLGKILAGAGCGEAEEHCQIHLSSCLQCHRLWDLFREEPAASFTFPAADLTQKVLAETSGPACNKARELLGDFVDRSLGNDTALLLADHLENCLSCRQLETALRELATVLPSMAAMEPGELFTQSVLEATSRRKTLEQRWTAWWQGLSRRPRFAWEAAYCGAVLGLLLFRFFPLLPNSPSLARLAMLEAKPAALWQTTASAASQQWSQGRLTASGLRESFAAALETNQQQWFTTLQEMGRKTSDRWEKTKLTLQKRKEQHILPLAGQVRRLWPPEKGGTSPILQSAAEKK